MWSNHTTRSTTESVKINHQCFKMSQTWSGKWLKDLKRAHVPKSAINQNILIKKSWQNLLHNYQRKEYEQIYYCFNVLLNFHEL